MKKHRKKDFRRFIKMVRIRLRRVGSKNQASYRIVVADKESPRDGKFLEIIGHYNPRTEPFTFQVKEDRVYDWMLKGAQPSDSLVQLFKSVGLMDRYARVKAGEDRETVLKEAEEFYANREVAPQTRRD
jgi:small subunit ribosomal protein S16